MKTNTRNKIYQHIHDHGPIGPTDLACHFEISPQMVHRHLKQLVADERVERLGSPPIVVYRANAKLKH